MEAMGSTVGAADQVRYESSVRRRYTVLAIVAGVLLVAQAIIQYTGPHAAVSELTLDLIVAHKRFPIDLIGAVIDCGGLIVLAVLLVWLHSITRARQPQTRDFIRWLTWIGAVLSGVMAIVYAVMIAVKANQFVAPGSSQSYMEANALTGGSFITLLELLAQLGSLLLTAGFIWTTLNATRVGLLTRFVGYLGAFAGLLVLFPIGTPVPVVQGFWLLSMAVLIAGRWPNGTPPAWETGLAVPWTPLSQPRERNQRQPSRQPRASRQQLAQSASRAKAKEERAQPAAQQSGAGGEAAAAARTRATTSKRKRKRRH